MDLDALGSLSFNAPSIAVQESRSQTPPGPGIAPDQANAFSGTVSISRELPMTQATPMQVSGVFSCPQ